MSDPKTVQLNKLLAVLPGIIKSVEYSELYGYDLNTIEDIPDGLIIRDRLLDKFLVANKYNVDQAAFQLQNTLEWRKNFNPLSAGFRENHEEVFKQIGVITSVPLSVAAPPRPGTAAYAAAAIRAKNAGPSNTTATDGQESESSDEEDEEEDEAQEPVPEAEDAPIGEEAGVKSVVADDATESKADEEADHEAEPEASEAAETEHEVATEHEPETSSKSTEDSESAPKGNIIVTWNLYGRVRDRAKVFKNLEAFIRYRVGLMERGIAALDFTETRTSYMGQVHDYSNVSFLFLDSATKEASKTTVEIFTKYYPEFLNIKYFVNVPRIMSWMFSVIKAFIPKATVDKFHVVSNGRDLALETGNLWVPIEYGGQSESLEAISIKEIEPRNESLVKKYNPKASKAKKTPKPIPAPVPTEFAPESAVEDPAEVSKAPIPEVPTTDTEETLETDEPDAVVNGEATEVSTAAIPEPGPTPTATATATATTAEDVAEESEKEVAAPEPGAVPQLPEVTPAVEKEEDKFSTPTHSFTIKEEEEEEDEEAQEAQVTEAVETHEEEPETEIAEESTTASKEVEPKTISA